jgi:hypothetical protein
MSKEFTKGVTIGQADEAAEKTTAAETTVEERDFSEDENKALVRANEEDFIQGLIDAADFVSQETQRIEIIRDGRLYFAFNIRPLSSEEYDQCKKKHTKYVRNKQLGMKLPEDTNRVKYQSAIIFAATVDADRANLWRNKKVWDALNNKGLQIMNELDVIEYTLKAGEKDRVIEAIDKLSGYDDNNLEEVAKN